MRIKSSILASLSLAFLITSSPAATIVAYVEAPTFQESSVSGVSTEYFDGLNAGISTSGFSSAIGLYAGAPSNPFAIVAADQYGGGAGTGNYFAVGSEANSDAPVSLYLTSAANYFGFWWSAGDRNNSITFLRDGIALATFTTANLVQLLPNTPSGTVTAINGSVYSTKDYYGNPNDHNDVEEPFAYVDVIANGLQFNEIQFSNANSTGFESDNHSVAAGVTDPPAGDVIVENVALTAAAQAPEPSTWFLMLMGGCSFCLLRKKPAKR